MNKKVRKAVIPVAGFGTRFLPVVKAIPKEMLPVVNKPVIQYIIEDLVGAGLETIILVNSAHKRATEDYFDNNFELESRLKETDKLEKLEEVEEVSEMANFIYVRQKEMGGNGDAILCAKEAVGNEPFVVVWGDCFLRAEPSLFPQIVETYNKYQSIVIAGYRTRDKEDTYRFAFVKGKELGDGVIEAEEFIEKPGPDKAPSQISTVSGFLYTPDIFEALEKVKIPKGQELNYTDGINYLMERNKKVYVKEIKNATYYECGDVLGYLKTNVEFALKDNEIKDEFRKYLKEKIK